jgi:hypothetical protein
MKISSNNRKASLNKWCGLRVNPKVATKCRGMVDVMMS